MVFRFLISNFSQSQLGRNEQTEKIHSNINNAVHFSLKTQKPPDKDSLHFMKFSLFFLFFEIDLQNLYIESFALSNSQLIDFSFDRDY